MSLIRTNRELRKRFNHERLVKFNDLQYLSITNDVRFDFGDGDWCFFFVFRKNNNFNAQYLGINGLNGARIRLVSVGNNIYRIQQTRPENQADLPVIDIDLMLDSSENYDRIVFFGRKGNDLVLFVNFRSEVVTDYFSSADS